MITTFFAGLVRAVGILLSIIISSECIYFLLFSETPEEARENYLFNPSRSKLLFSGAFNPAKENSVCNPDRFKNAKLIAKAMSFIFFMPPGRNRYAMCMCKNHSSSGKYFSNSENNYSSIHPENYHSSSLQRYDVTRKLFANGAMQNLTTCLWKFLHSSRSYWKWSPARQVGIWRLKAQSVKRKA